MTRRLPLRAVGLALLVAFAPATLGAQAPGATTLGSAPLTTSMPFPDTAKKDKGVVDGTAIDALNNPLANDVVRLLTPKGKKVAETMSSAQGKFQFVNIDPGKDYVVQVRNQDRVVGIAGNIEIKPGIVTPTMVTGVTQLARAPGGGFNKKRFIIYSVIITVVASILVAKR